MLYYSPVLQAINLHETPNMTLQGCHCQIQPTLVCIVCMGELQYSVTAEREGNLHTHTHKDRRKFHIVSRSASIVTVYYAQHGLHTYIHIYI